MDMVTLIVIIAVAAVAIIGGGIAGLVTTTRRRKGRTLPTQAETDVITRPEAPAVDETAEPETVPSEPTAPVIEKPESTASRLVRLRQRLAGSNALGRGLLNLLSNDRLDEDTWESIEDLLLTADIGVAPTQELVEGLRTRLRVEGGKADVKAALRDELIKLVDPDMDRRLQVSGADGAPGVVLMVGVNGTGKTTTTGKLARILVSEDRKVVLGAADTFRAAAAEQLTTWGERGSASRSSAARRAPTRPASPSTRSRRAWTPASTRSSSTPPDGCRTRPA
jgi:fused signal recognition particle receptor